MPKKNFIPKKFKARDYMYFELPPEKIKVKGGYQEMRDEDGKPLPNPNFVYRWVLNNSMRIEQMQRRGWEVWKDIETKKEKIFGGQILLFKDKTEYEEETMMIKNEEKRRLKSQIEGTGRKNIEGVGKSTKAFEARTLVSKVELT